MKKPISNFIPFLCFILISCAGWSQNLRKAYNEKTVYLKKFEVIDIVFQSQKKTTAPFEVDFGAVFTKPNGDTLKVPGFYNGNKEWILRFSANELNNWSYTTYASLKDLKNKRGKIKVIAPLENKHGAMGIDKNDPKKFAYEDGTPYFLQGFEIDWLFALDYDNPDEAPKTKHLLDLLSKNKFNQVVTTLYSYEVRWKKDPKLKFHPEHDFGSRNDIFPFLGSNKAPDYSALNVTFFKRFDRVVSLMNERDIIANLMIYVWNKKVKWPVNGSPEDDRYFDYVMKRYQAFPNVVWNISKEAFRRKAPYMTERFERAKKNNTFNRLITIHDFKKAKDIDLDFVALQDWSSTLYTNMLEAYNKNKGPVFNIEHGGYANSTYTVFPGDYTNPETCLKRNYICYFAGVYANHYWQDIAWNVMVYNPEELSDDFVKPKFEYYKHLFDFFNTYNYQDFKPFPKLNRSGYCLKNNSGTYLFYIPKENFQLSSYGIKPIVKKEGTYQWFNTLTGTYSKEIPYKGGHFENPFHGIADAILIRKTK